MFFGGNSPGSEERALEYGDGWGPIALPDIPERVRAFRAAGHDMPVVAFGVATDAAVIEEHASAGTSRVVLMLESARAGEIERSLEELLRCVATAVG
jgi:alkanesulfonate monooxygenase SsuD/methylene tetrahydromethanopterin reductase-like flavin-dependent oxidoreductase (luciferase family)